ncbi:MAG: hypothetical protein HY815_16135 [Candidatus Riflebacteria bacterium]|nr:hypothetical protein [Candidatus Riflebacteria bacterium]
MHRLVALTVLWLPLVARVAAAPEAPTCTVEERSGELFAAVERHEPRRVAAGERLTGVQTLRSGVSSRARLVSPQGWALHLGSMTRTQLAPGKAPILMTQGQLRVDNRPGDADGLAVIVATRLAEVHVPSDGRALVWCSRQSGKIPQTLRVVALHRPATVRQPDGSRERTVAAGQELSGAGWIPVSRWKLRTVPAAELARIERHAMTPPEAEQAAAPLPAIPEESLRLQGSTLLTDRKIYLTRADIPPTGEIVVTGEVLRERLPKELGTFKVLVSRDGGVQWDRLSSVDPEGAFDYHFTPQEGVEYQLLFAVAELLTGKTYQTTRVYRIVFFERFTPVFSDLKLCGVPFAAKAGQLSLYADELREFSVTLEGAVASNGPLSRVAIEASPDAGVRWRRAKVTVSADPSQGLFRATFPPVPGALYKLRLRSTYADASEAIKPHQTLADWEAPVDVSYKESRSTERATAVVKQLERCLAGGDLRGASSLFSTHFNLQGRQLGRALKARLTPGAVAREAGTLQIAVRWERPDDEQGARSGDAVFLLVKEADWVLLDILKDDPFAAPSIVTLRSPGDEGAASGVETITMGLDSVFDFDEQRSQPYSAQRIPDDLGFFKERIGDDDVPVLGTHDRRLAVVGKMELASVKGFSRKARIEYRAWVVPEEGTTYYLKTRSGRDLLFEVLEASGIDGVARSPRVKLGWVLLAPDRE